VQVDFRPSLGPVAGWCCPVQVLTSLRAHLHFINPADPRLAGVATGNSKDSGCDHQNISHHPCLPGTPLAPALKNAPADLAGMNQACIPGPGLCSLLYHHACPQETFLTEHVCAPLV